MLIRLCCWCSAYWDTFDCDKCRNSQSSYCDKDGLWYKSLGSAGYPRFSALPKDILEGLGEPKGLECCPLSYRPKWWPKLLDLHKAWQNGILPRDGGLKKQPAMYMQLMNYITSMDRKYRDERREREKKNGNK